VNVTNVNVATRNRITKEQMFKEKEPRKNNIIVDWKKDFFLKTMVDIGYNNCRRHRL
jgi:hypothetical protein